MMPPANNDIPDQLLLKRATQGDAESFGDLYVRYLDEIQRYIYYRVADRLTAEDLTEMVFVKAWESLGKSHREIDHLRAWLYRIAHNLVVDHYRNHKTIVDYDDGQLLGNQANPAIEKMDFDGNQELTKAIQSLDDRMQQVIICRFINGLSHAETARVLGIREGHVRVLQLRALTKLRMLLEKI